jgi:hypothetical protein
MVRAKPGEDSGVTGPLIIRARDVPQGGSEVEFLLEVGAPAEMESGRILLGVLIAEVQPWLPGFALLGAVQATPLQPASQEQDIGPPPPPVPPTKRGQRRSFWMYGITVSLAVVILVIGMSRFTTGNQDGSPQGNAVKTPETTTYSASHPPAADEHSLAADERVYAAEVSLQTVEIYSIVASLDSSLHQRYFYLDKTWQPRIMSDLERAREVIEDIDALHAPPTMLNIDTTLKEAGIIMGQAIDLISMVLDSYDTTKMKSCIEMLSKVTGKNQEAVTLLIAFEASRE